MWATVTHLDILAQNHYNSRTPIQLSVVRHVVGKCRRGREPHLKETFFALEGARSEAGTVHCQCVDSLFVKRGT